MKRFKKIRNSFCVECDLCENATNVCLMEEPTGKRKVMVVGDSPSEWEDRKGQIFTGKVGKLLQDLFLQYGLSEEEVYLTNAVKCFPGEKNKPGVKQMKACKYFLEKELARVQPEYVLCLGADAVKSVIGKTKVTEIHGQIFDIDGIKYMPSFHPAMAIRDPKKLGPIRLDIEKFCRLVRGEVTHKTYKMHPVEVNTFAKLKECFADIKKNTVVSFDIETTGLNPRAEDAAVTTIIIGTKKFQWILFFNVIPGAFFTTYALQKNVLECLEYLLADREVVMQGGQFDNLYLRVLYGLRINRTFDTMLASHLLDENTPNDLKYMARNTFHAEDYDIPLDVKTGKVEDKPKLLKYAAGDGFYTLKLFHHFQKLLEDEPELKIVYEAITMPSSIAYEEIEYNGVYIDEEAMEVQAKAIQGERAKLERKLNKLLGEKINWGSPDQVSNALYEDLGLPVPGTTPKGKPSTSNENLLKLKGKHKVVDTLIKFREVEKLDNGFIKGWQKRMVDGYLYPRYAVHGTVTGRPSCSNPNLQQTPRDSRIRSLPGAPPGWTFFEADYSQVELRVAAVVAQEDEMLLIFINGGDLHRTTATAVSGIPEDEITGDERFKAKAVNFGFIYGMGPPKFQIYAKDEYGVDITLSESRTFRKRFFERYPGLEPWHKRQRNLVRRAGQVRTLTGRIRHLPEIYSPDKGLQSEAERQAINSPVQGMGAEITLMSFIETDRKIKAGDYGDDNLRLVGTVHDATLGMVRTSMASEIMPQVIETMENPPLMDELGIDFPIPLVVDCAMGSWAKDQGIPFEKWLDKQN